ncbi:MAG: sugar transferase [Gemmataceae bacterium]
MSNTRHGTIRSHGGDTLTSQLTNEDVDCQRSIPQETIPYKRPFSRSGVASTPAPLDSAGRTCYQPIKNLADRVIAFFLLIPALPIVGIASLLVKWTSRGPALYSQVRVGKNGSLFTIYKIRSMIHNCESLTGPRWSLPGDPRVTRIGAFLRATHLDELPQLWNVVRGEMSLIGPRPERPEFIPTLEKAIPSYRQRLSVKPGVTGISQVLLPSDSDMDSVRQKLTLDLYYIRHLGPWLDSWLFACTILHVAGLPARRWNKWLLDRAHSESERRSESVSYQPRPRMRKSA